MLKMPNVTLVTIITRQHHLGKEALLNYTQAVEFRDIVVFTDKVKEFPGRCIHVSPRQRRDWCVWRLTQFPRYRSMFANHILFTESDSRIVNPAAWTDEFYQYDYIGAPWHGGRVGNGGFTLMSQRLLAGLESFKIPASPAVCYPCDGRICKFYRPSLEKLGCQYASKELANKFSNECGEYIGAFGVHSWYMIGKAREKGLLK